jgi:hypothetical protein
MIEKMKSFSNAPTDDLSVLSNSLARISAGLAMRALGYVDFHHMDDDFAEGKLDPRYVPVVRRSIKLASPDLFPAGIKTLVSALKEHLAKLEEAMLQSDLKKAKSESHEAHERYHELQTKVNEWLG